MNLLQKMAGSSSPKLQHPFRAMAGYVLQNTGLSDRMKLQRSTYQVPFFSRSNVALTLWVDTMVIDPVEEFAVEFLHEGDTFIDVGANIGCVTAAGAMSVGPAGQVYSIEAHPRTYAYLQKTVSLNHATNVSCINVALGASDGKVCFTDERRKDDNNRVSQDTSSGLEVPCVPLTSIVRANSMGQIALLKIDVEGFEMQVLRGAEPILPQVDCMYIEVLDHTLRKFGSSAEEVLDFVRSKGFELYRFRNDDMNIVAVSERAKSRRVFQELKPLSAP
ncbi:MAG: FkbM family methyltransferase [Planctomycetota bacterium]